MVGCRLQEETWQLVCPDASSLHGQVAGSPKFAAADLQLALVQPEDVTEPATPGRPSSQIPQPDWQLLCQRWDPSCSFVGQAAAPHWFCSSHDCLCNLF